MKTYIIKRLLIMIPTFFGISLIVFIVLNFAPGHPGGTQQSMDFASQVRSERSAESYRIFREQFNLDKPILFNTRFLLDRDHIEEMVAVASGAVHAPVARRIADQETLQDYGQYAVPHLIAILKETDNPEVRDGAAYFLRLNARRRLVNPFASHPDEATARINREIDLENARLRQMSYPLEAPEAVKIAVIEQWTEWYDEYRSRWEYSLADKVRMFFLETRFATYWSNLLRLDFGVSLVSREPVLQTLAGKLKYSISLSITSLLLAYFISIPIGILSAVWKDTLMDRTLTVALFILYSLPSFFVGALLLFYFSEGSDVRALRWFPVGGWRSANYMELTTVQQLGDIVWHLALPVLCLTYGSLAALSRYMRVGLLDVIRSDYIRTARAKGLAEWTVIMKHAVRNGLIPILTLMASLLPAVLGGSVIIEVIFSIPGMGLWMIDSIYQRDYNVIMAIQLLSTVLTLVGILLSDLSYALVDPRITYD